MKRIIAFSLIGMLLASVPIFVSAQVPGHPPTSVQKLLRKANVYIMRRQYKEAEILLNKAKEKVPENPQIYFSLSGLYNRMGEVEKEEKSLKKVIELDSEFANAYYNLGSLYLNNGEYKKAIPNFENFMKQPDVKERYVKFAQEKIEKARTGARLKSVPVPFDPRNMGANVNSEFDEYYPTLTADGLKLFFTRKIEIPTDDLVPDVNEDAFFTVFDGQEWQKAMKPRGELNSAQYNEGAITIAPDGKTIVFTGCNWPGGKGRCDLYYSSYENGAWTKPENLGAPVNTEHMETQPSLSFDGKTLYFTSSRPGGEGKFDLYRSKQNSSGDWLPAKNLGNKINTPEDEQSPFIHHDNKHLYFSSDGLPGLGGRDLFRATQDASGVFAEPENMGYPINDHKDQLSIFVTADAQNAYFSSARKGGLGGLDIYTFKLHERLQPEKVTYIKGTVVDYYTKKPLRADFKLTDLQNGEEVVSSYSDAKDGEFQAPVPSGKEYAIEVSKEGYLFHSDNLSLKDNSSKEPYKTEVGLKPIAIGEKVILKNIFFEFDKYSLQKKSKVELERLIKFMKDNPQVKIQISGHTDSKGSETYNQDLSENRAKRVYNYLISEGNISAERLEYKGYGQRKPIATNETDEGRALNRRTEFEIIGI